MQYKFALHKNNLGTWPIFANMGNIKYTFSGSFEKNRIRTEFLHFYFNKILKLLLITIGFLGLLALVILVNENYKTLNWQLLLQKNIYNKLFWLGLLCDMYLWAKVSQDGIDQQCSNILNIEPLTESSKEETVDIYSLFNQNTKDVWNRSFAIAKKMGEKNPYGSHLFLSLIDDNHIKLVFARLGIRTTDLKTIITNYLLLSKPEEEIKLDSIPFTALSESLKLHNNTIDPLMLLCALCIELPDSHIIQETFFNIGLDIQTAEILSSWIFTINIWSKNLQIFQQLAKFKPDNELNQGLTAIPTPYLDQFSMDLTKMAKYGQLPLAWGRSHDTQELFNRLQDGKPAVVIKGYEGTGRSTLIYELAYKMAAEQVPNILQDKRLVKIDMAGILATPQKSETVLLHALEESVRSGNIVLVIEDIHQLAKTKTSQGLSLLEMLINFLESNSIQIFATTTLSDCMEYLKNTQNFEQIFSEFELGELTTTEILLACCTKASILEYKNKCFFLYQSIKQAINLSDAYIFGGKQPNKAITILVDAANRVKGKKGNTIITETFIQKIISEKTHIPSQTLNENESEKLLNLETELKKGVIGQSSAIVAVSEALRRARSGLASSSRPLASFLFLGPTGVGKTELAKQLTAKYFGDEKYLLRLDMSEFHGPDGIAKFIGSNTNQNNTPLITHLKNYPFCLLLADEFEKASLEVHNLFLQILEDGRLTTNKGEVIDLTHSMIIATSNAGSREIQDGLLANKTMDQIKTTLFNQTLKNAFPPELLNRFDGIILFSSLTENEIEQITVLQLEYLRNLLLEKGVKISFTKTLIQDIAKNAYDPQFGARPIRRYIQDHIEGHIAKMLLSKKLSHGSEITLDIKNGKVISL